jgi:uncharacterized protein (TIGR04255 family)
LATFSDPPVRHVELTVYFKPIHALRVSHLSSLREAWKDDYPVVAELAPLRPRNRGGQEADVTPYREAWPFPYVMLSSKDDSRSVAFQNDRFVVTWAFDETDASYPGFEKISAHLRDLLGQLRDVVSAETEQDLDLTRSECWYLNELPDIPATELLVGVATRWHGSAGSSELPPSHYSGFRLHIDDEDHPTCGAEISLDIDNDGASLIIASRFDVENDQAPDEVAGLTIAHDLLIRQFLAFTSPEMQKAWGRS